MVMEVSAMVNKLIPIVIIISRTISIGPLAYAASSRVSLMTWTKPHPVVES